MSQNAHWKSQRVEIYSSAIIEVNSKWTDDSMQRMLHLNMECSEYVVRERESIILAAMIRSNRKLGM